MGAKNSGFRGNVTDSARAGVGIDPEFCGSAHGTEAGTGVSGIAGFLAVLTAVSDFSVFAWVTHSWVTVLT